MSCSFTNQVLAQLNVLRKWKEPEACKNDENLLPMELDEKVSKVHGPALGAKLTVLTQEKSSFFRCQGKALSRERTTVIELYGSVEGFIIGSVFVCARPVLAAEIFS